MQYTKNNDILQPNILNGRANIIYFLTQNIYFFFRPKMYIEYIHL